MKTTVGTKMFCFVLILAFVDFAYGQSVVRSKKCKNQGGFCMSRVAALRGSCNGIVYHNGCSTYGFSCCIEGKNADFCFKRDSCTKAKGYCVGKGKWKSCNGYLDRSGCKGNKCACCIPGAKRGIPIVKPECRQKGGFCIKKNIGQCQGTTFNKGCSGDQYTCCIEDTSLCIAKPKCTNDVHSTRSSCLKKDEWATCAGAVDSSGCHGDDCGCCKEGKCRLQAGVCSKNNGDYCYEKDTNHKCKGTTVLNGCTGQNCVCCKKTWWSR